MIRYVFGTLAVIFVIALYYKCDPNTSRFFPACPFYKITGLDCPGCGSQRAVHALLHGDVFRAMDHNLLLVLSLPVLFMHFLFKIAAAINGSHFEWQIWYQVATPKVVLVIVLVFWAARNLPVFPFHYLAA